jgi:hypothetical protein
VSCNAKHCRDVIKKAVDDLGGIDIHVNNAAHQATFKGIGDISDEDWEKTFRTNIHSMFYLTKAAVLHMKPGSAIINTASVNSDMPNPMLLAYATTKGAIQNFTGGLAQMLVEKGIRANAVAPGPIWTPLIPSTMPDDAVKNFGKQVPMKRPGQRAELATAYVSSPIRCQATCPKPRSPSPAASRSSDGRPQASRNPRRVEIDVRPLTRDNSSQAVEICVGGFGKQRDQRCGRRRAWSSGSRCIARGSLARRGATCRSRTGSGHRMLYGGKRRD